MPKRVYHKPPNKPYAYGCTEAAIKRAHAMQYDAIDLDVTWSADDVRMVNHWAQLVKMDAWHDPRGVHGNEANVNRIEATVLKRFTSPYGELLSVYEALGHCEDVGIIPCLELKTDRLNRDRDLRLAKRFRAQCDRHGWDPVMMTEPRSGKGIQALKVHHAAGFRTMWLWRGSYPARYDKYLTYVKSRPGHGIYRP